MSNVVIHHPRHPLPERWMVLAGRNGEYVPMTPKRIPFCGSRHEAHERTRLLLGMDEVFRAKWDGWTFYMVTLEDAVVNRAEQRGIHVRAS